MIVCDRQEVEEPVPPQAPCQKCVDVAINECKLAFLRALGAAGFHIVHYSYQESKFRVELLGLPAGVCVELSSQEYFRLTEAMEAHQEVQATESEVVTTTAGAQQVPVDALQEIQPNEREVVTTTEETVISPPERTKSTRGRYLKKMLPMLSMKRRSEKESSQIQIRQRIATFMICLLRLFEKKKKPAKAAEATASAETAKEGGKEGSIPSTTLLS